MYLNITYKIMIIDACDVTTEVHTMVKLDSFHTFDMQWMILMCYCIDVLRRNTRLDTHNNIGKGTETDRVSLSVWPHLHRRV